MIENKFKLLAGPCVIESEDSVMLHAEALKRIVEKFDIDFYFKASWDKANRTKATNYRGPGLDEGLRILDKAKTQVGVKIVTDIHEPGQAASVAQVADIIQIPAFLCRQTDLLKAAADTGKIVNIKLQKGQNTIRLSNPTAWMPNIDYIEVVPVIPAAIEATMLGTDSRQQAYDLQGRPARNVSSHGILITNGKKVLR